MMSELRLKVVRLDEGEMGEVVGGLKTTSTKLMGEVGGGWVIRVQFFVGGGRVRNGELGGFGGEEGAGEDWRGI